MDIVTIFLTPPPDFSPKFEASGIYCKFQDKILLLKRHAKKPQGDTWGVPAGKIESGEDPKETIVRETLEEVGFSLDNFEEMTKLFVRYNGQDFIFHMFFKEYGVEPKISLCEEEHTEARWVTPEEALLLPLIGGGEESLEYYLKFLSEKKGLGLKQS